MSLGKHLSCCYHCIKSNKGMIANCFTIVSLIFYVFANSDQASVRFDTMVAAREVFA